MIIRTVGFDPLRIEVDGKNSSPIEETYQDEDGNSRKIIFISVDGKKIPIQHRAEIFEDVIKHGIDIALQKVETARSEKLKEPK